MANVEMIHAVENIGPEQAKKYLGMNYDKNRTVRQAHVVGLAEQMKAGQWVLSAQGIIFDENGTLIDGQHRLMAIIKAGVVVPITVTRGAPEASFKVLDSGSGRTMADALMIPRKVVSVIALGVLAGSNSRVSRKYHATEVERVYMEIGSICEAVTLTKGASSRYFGSATTSLMAVCAILNGYDQDPIIDSLTRLRLCSLDFMTPAEKPLTQQVMYSTARSPGNSGTVYATLDQAVRIKKAITRPEISRITVTELDKTEALAYVKETFAKV